jgi:hypothetical protein
MKKIETYLREEEVAKQVICLELCNSVGVHTP